MTTPGDKDCQSECRKLRRLVSKLIDAVDDLTEVVEYANDRY